MVNKIETFRTLHVGRAPGDPQILPGPWDAASARVFAEAGFPALATPSAGVADPERATEKEDSTAVASAGVHVAITRHLRSGRHTSPRP
ncbi:hypothetical protein GCM10023080_084370 [Streptomyces pseudoechinosporeus]